MGADTNIFLPGNVRVSDVAKVVAACAGLPVRKEYFSNNSGGWCARVDGVEVKTTSVPEMCFICWKDPSGEGRMCYYHFEDYRGSGRLVSARSKDFWIATGIRLVDFFGGFVDFNDCDGISCDYAKPDKGNDTNNPQTGDPWYQLQERLIALTSLTQEELDYANNFAAYSNYRWDGLKYLKDANDVS